MGVLTGKGAVRINCDVCTLSCNAALEMLLGNIDLRRKWNGAVEWLHDELERVGLLYDFTSTTTKMLTCI